MTKLPFSVFIGHGLLLLDLLLLLLLDLLWLERLERLELGVEGGASAGRAAPAIVVAAPLVPQLLLAAPLGPPVGEPHLDARLRQRDLLGEALARIHVRVVRALELLLQRVDLLLAEAGAVALQLALQSEARLRLLVVLQVAPAVRSTLVVLILTQVRAVQVFCKREKRKEFFSCCCCSKYLFRCL